MSCSLHDLVDCIKRSEQPLLSGEVILSLIPAVVTHLSRDLVRLPSLLARSARPQPAVIGKRANEIKYEELLGDLQYLGFIAERVSALKILHNNDATLQGTLSLQPFRSLRFLEVRKVPLHLVKGLTNLRGQLECIVCSRAMQSLELLLLKCGGDASQVSQFSWPHLKTLVCTDCDIEELDNSLTLVPSLQNLDLSRNSLRSCREFLAHLEELTVVNLSNNRLEKIPKFSTFGRSRLRVLTLRNNCLESIENVEDLENLQELDLSENCIADHKLLWPFRQLARLARLNLSGNPIQFDPKHRLLTMKYLNPRAVKDRTLVLDNVKVSATEAMTVPEMISRPLPRSISSTEITVVSIESPNNGQLAGADDLSSSVRSSGGRRKAIKTRIIELGEPEAHQPRPVPPAFAIPAEPLSSILGTSSSSAFIQDMEELRERFGEEWLKFQAAKEPESDTSAETLPVVDATIPNFAEEIGHLETQEVLDRSDSLEPPQPTESGENESSPFLITTQTEESLLVTVGDVHIIERNILGIIAEMLEIGSIQKADLSSDSDKDVVMYFDYVRKDRRKRNYCFEDADQAEEFLSLIQPLIETKAEKSMMFECLQCNERFPEYQAERKIKYLAKSDFSYGYPSSVGSASASQKGELTETVSCPFCNSEMLVKHEDDEKDASSRTVVSASVPVKRPEMANRQRSNSVVVLTDEPSDLEETVLTLPSSYRSPSLFVGSPISERSHSVAGDMDRQDSSEETLFSVQTVEETLQRLRAKSADILDENVKWDYDDFTKVDHRSRLHIDMNVLQSEEHFGMLAKTGYLNMKAASSCESVVLVSNLRIHVFKLEAEMTGEPSSWLTAGESVPIQNVDLVHQVCEGECLRIGFNDRTFWLILLRDRQRCARFAQQFEDILTTNKVPFFMRETSDLVALETWLAATPFESEDAEPSLSVSLRTMCYMGKSPVTLLCTETHVIITRDDYQQLLRGGHTDSLTLVDAKPISAISCLVAYMQTPTEIGLKFFDEDPDCVNQWDFRFESVDGLERLVQAVRDPWENLVFHVPLNFEVHP